MHSTKTSVWHSAVLKARALWSTVASRMSPATYSRPRRAPIGVGDATAGMSCRTNALVGSLLVATIPARGCRSAHRYAT
ncbi:hypothetical protein V8C86DRAFT_2845591 [Haematococcus lacustris]